jgi:hypothetical protein
VLYIKQKVLKEAIINLTITQEKITNLAIVNLNNLLKKKFIDKQFV